MTRCVVRTFFIFFLWTFFSWNSSRLLSSSSLDFLFINYCTVLFFLPTQQYIYLLRFDLDRSKPRPRKTYYYYNYYKGDFYCRLIFSLSTFYLNKSLNKFKNLKIFFSHVSRFLLIPKLSMMENFFYHTHIFRFKIYNYPPNRSILNYMLALYINIFLGRLKL